MVRPGTVGVERNKVVFFYDVTRTAAVGYSRDYCLENPYTFAVSKTLADREVRATDVIKILRETLSAQQMNEIEMKIKSL